MPPPGPTAAVPETEGDPFEGTPYRGVARLGAGGMGELHAVEHRELGREFVAKILHKHLAAEPRLVDRFRIEAQSLGRLSHPHIVSVVGFNATADGRPFLVFERLRGRSLSDELAERKRLPALEAVTYACQLLSALGAVHGLGVVHRDIKPDNLFICDRPDGTRYLKVLDFGVARVMPGASADAPVPLSLPTDTGVVIGTPRFVSPEGATGQRVDRRADVYAAALVLYVMLAGRGPFDHRESDALLLSAHASEEPEAPSAFTPEPISGDLDRIILKALRKNPDERFQDVEELSDALVALAESLSAPPGWSETAAFRAQSTAPAPSAEVSPIEAARENRTAAGASAPGGALPRSALVILFVVVMVVTAVGVALLVGLLRGARA
jgi:eukaryotic-like serine/threonine-protein kinase